MLPSGSCTTPTAATAGEGETKRRSRSFLGNIRRSVGGGVWIPTL